MVNTPLNNNRPKRPKHRLFGDLTGIIPFRPRLEGSRRFFPFSIVRLQPSPILAGR